MEFLVGIEGDGFVLVAADRNGGRGIVRMKDGQYGCGLKSSVLVLVRPSRIKGDSNLNTNS